MTQRGKFVKEEAQKYLASKGALAWQIKQQMVENGWEMFPPKTPLSVCIFIGSKSMHNRDLDNSVKAILDACQGVVFENDNYVDRIMATRSRSSVWSIILVIDEKKDED